MTRASLLGRLLARRPVSPLALLLFSFALLVTCATLLGTYLDGGLLGAVLGTGTAGLLGVLLEFRVAEDRTDDGAAEGT
ncbi:MAG TPA: hypothetical protein VGD67_09865 [Pseudonocardiaceae bacterium]